METMYQRGKIQDESLHYEHLKHTGDFPIVGANTFLSDKAAEDLPEVPLSRSTPEEKDARLEHLGDFQGRHAKASGKALKQLQNVAMAGGNVFEELLKTVQSCSLGQITHALYEVGGRYRRSM